MSANLITVEPPVDVLALKNPFTFERTRLVLRGGETITEILAKLDVPPWADAWVELDGWRVPRALWPRTRPKAGHRLVVRLIPGMEGGGGDDNKTLRIIILAVILIVAIVTTILTWGALGPVWALALGGALLTVGSFAVNMLLPPALPSIGKLAAINGATGRPQESPTLSITGSRNSANPYGPIPKIYGRHRLFPPLGAVTYTEQVGNEQYLRQLFVVGYGPLALSDLKIGETPLAEFDGVDIEIRPGALDDEPLTLYSQDVAEEPLTIALTFAGGPQVRVGTQPADELSVDVVFPNGLVQYLNSGEQLNVTVNITVEYRKVGDTTWIEPPGSPLIITDNRTSQVRRGFRWTPPPTGQPERYEIRLTRTNADTADVLIHDQALWSSLRTIRWAPPITMPGLCQVALRIKATDQLNGVVDQFNCIAEAILPDWDGPTQTWIPRATRNPAAAYREVLQGPGNARPIADSRIDLVNLAAWAEEAALQGYFYDQVIDFRTTVFEQLRIISSAGRAGFTLIDGKHGVVQDLPQTVPVQHFSPRNSWGFKSTKSLPDPVHAWKVHFINPDADWQQDELLVYADGFDAANATKFEVFELAGVTDRVQAHRLGRYHHAALKLRPEVYELNVDVENLICTRGDLVRVTHDVPRWGYGAARVTAVTIDAGSATGISLDDVFAMAAGRSYVVRIRLADGTSVIQPVETIDGSTKAVTFLTPMPAPLPEVGDLVLFGELGQESVEAIVRQIEHDHDFVAKVTLLDAAPAIHGATTGPIPDFDTHMTRPPDLQQTPPVPVIDDVRSDETVLARSPDGTLDPRIVLSMRYVANSGLRADWIEVQYRRVDSVSPYIGLPHVPPNTPVISVFPVEERVTYDMRLKTVSAGFNVASAWITARHTVVGKTSSPPDVTGLALEGTLLTWIYPTRPADFAGFEVRQIAGSVANWEQGLRLHDGFLTATSFTLPTLMGLRTLMVRALDNAGNSSAGTAALTHDFGAALLHNIVETRDEHALGFSGTIVDGTVSGITGDLEADQEPALFWGPDPAPFWTNDAALFWTSPYRQLRYTWTYVTGTTAQATTLLIDLAAQGAPLLEYKRSADTAWLPFAGAVSGVEASTSYDLRVTVAGGPTQGIISTLTLFLDAPDIMEALEDVAIAVTTGTRLPITLPFRTVKSVSLTVVASGAETAITARTQDKDATLGPLVQTLDAVGAVVAGHVDAQVRGF